MARPVIVGIPTAALDRMLRFRGNAKIGSSNIVAISDFLQVIGFGDDSLRATLAKQMVYRPTRKA